MIVVEGQHLALEITRPQHKLGNTYVVYKGGGDFREETKVVTVEEGEHLTLEVT